MEIIPCFRINHCVKDIIIFDALAIVLMISQQFYGSKNGNYVGAVNGFNTAATPVLNSKDVNLKRWKKSNIDMLK